MTRPGLACIALLVSFATALAAPRRPNLVLIVTDNQGAWTLGCYGNPDVQTPVIDGLAKQGILFERCFASNPVCSPTRATLMTGLIPSQHGVHSYLRAGEPQVGPKAHCVISEFRTLPKVLAEAGYACGLSGKWHLGGNLTPQEGFSYWVTMPHGHTTTFYNADVIDAGKVRKEPKYLTDFWTDHGVRFIEQHRDRPFFLYLAYNGPYGLGADVLRPARNRHAAYYADKDLPSFPRGPAHPWLRGNREALNNLTAIRRYAAEVTGVDDGVGRILETLKKLGLADDTLVVFTADQGWGGGQHGLWGMADHSRPPHAFDETMHVPLIVRWPGRAASGKRSDRIVRNYDIYPTLLDCLDLSAQVPANPRPPGRSFAPMLRGEQVEWDDVAFYEFETTRAVRTADWKYVRRFPNGPDELYDLRHDPGERVNLADRPEHAEVRKRFGRRLEEFFAAHADAKYDIWRGGRSKAPRIGG